VIRIKADDRMAYLPAAPGAADLVVRANATAFAGKTAEAKQRIQVKQIEVKIEPASSQMRTESTASFVAVAYNATNPRVTWSASAGSIDANGNYTAPAQPGTYTLTAASVSNAQRKATATVEVKSGVVVRLDPASATLEPGAHKTFLATVEGATNTAVQWSATAGSITSDGVFTAPNALGTTVTVTARSVQDPDATGTATVRVDTAASGYTIALIDPFGYNRGMTSKDFGVNRNGQVAGTTIGGVLPVAFLWQNGQTTSIHAALASEQSVAAAINDAGQVAGGLRNPDQGDYRAFRWQGGQASAFSPSGSEGRGINNAGDVVGSSGMPAIWRDGQFSLLPTPSGTTSGAALDISDAGQIVGYVYGSSGRAVLWENGQMIELPELYSVTAINNAGQVAGTSSGGRAAIWQNGQMTDLGSLGGSASAASDINDAGQVVGQSRTADGKCHPFLWQGGKMIDLTTLVPSSLGLNIDCSSNLELKSVAISNAGHILILRAYSAGAVLLTPKQ
jgi:probable HAF family extracellular repeat protein